MNTELTKTQIDHYRRDGFVVHRGLLGPDEVAELKAAVLDAVEEMKRTMGRQKVVGGNENLVERETYYDTVFTQRLNLWRMSATVRRYMLHAGLGRMASELEGCDGYRISQDQALIKEPFGNPTGWHLDNVYGPYHHRNAITVWIALEDSTLENGCLWFVPGSMRLAGYDRKLPIGEKLGVLFEAYPEMLATADPVPAPLRAGDCSFHNGMVAHGAGANMTSRRRIGMTATYMPVGSRFNGNPGILPKHYVESLRIGDEMANDDWNPVVYQK